MPIQSHYLEKYSSFQLLAKEIVEGFLTGLHKSPFHGFSVEFAEHKIYNPGDSTKNIDWKLYARTEKLFLKAFEEETNLKCSIVVDVSSSMHYPKSNNSSLEDLNKLGFSLYAAGALITLLGKQRDACGLVTFSEGIEFSSPMKGSKKHFKFLFDQLEECLGNTEVKQSDISYAISEVAMKSPKRGLVFIFSDFSTSSEIEVEALIDSVLQLKHKNNEVVIFNVVDKHTEVDFDFSNKPLKFVDLETSEEVKLTPLEFKETYVNAKFKQLTLFKDAMLQHRVSVVDVDVKAGFHVVLESYLINRLKLK